MAGHGRTVHRWALVVNCVAMHRFGWDSSVRYGFLGPFRGASTTALGGCTLLLDVLITNHPDSNCFIRMVVRLMLLIADD